MQLLRRSCVLAIVVLFSLAIFAQNSKPSTVPTPSQFLGFEVGADRQLADYKQIGSYLKKLAEVSPRIQVVSLGKSTLGNDMGRGADR